MRILIIKLGAVGDVVHTLPSLRSLRASFPDAFIAWVVEEKSRDVITGNPDLNEVIVFERKRIQRDVKGIIPKIKEVMGFIERVRGYDFDVAIDFQTLFKSGIIADFSGAKTRVGFDKWRELNKLFTNQRVRSKKDNVVDKYLELVEAVGAKPVSDPVRIYYSEGDASYINRFLTDSGLNQKRWIAVNPGASWKTKLWGVERFAGLCDKLSGENIPVVLIWGPGEEHLVKGILERSKSTPIVAPKTTIKQLACLLERSEMYVGGDTGPLHMAVAMGRPVIGIYGPSDPVRNGPYGNYHTVLQADIKCKSCWKKKGCNSMECMEKITVDDVAKAVLNRMNATNNIESR